MNMFDEEILSKIRPFFENVILMRGWNYYLDHAVRQIDLRDQRIEAVVKGTTPYQVHLDIGNFSASYCTCPYEEACKHMAAVLFEAVAQSGGQPVELLSPRKKLASVPKTTPTAKSSVREMAYQLPKETDAVAEWHTFFRNSYKQRMQNGFQAIPILYMEETNLYKRVCQTWAPALQSLFYLHGWLFLMQQFEKLNEMTDNRYSYQNKPHYYRSHARQCLEDLVRGLANLEDQSTKERYLPYFESTIDYLAEHAFPVKSTVTDWLEVYITLWERVLFYMPWMEKERDRLSIEIENPYLTPMRKEMFMRALLHFEIVLENDDQARELVESRPFSASESIVFSYLHTFAQSEQWQRLVKWLIWMQPKLNRENRRDVDICLNLWRGVYVKGHVNANEYEQVLMPLLPMSYWFASDFLIEQGRYQDWVDLHLYYETSPIELDKGDLKTVETHEAASLLPLYHQAVERHILEKNRDSYKLSVKLLKKLLKYYRSLKQLPRWERYIEALSTKYKRYRAFQEELKKGKLIP